MIEITFAGAADTVTGSCHLIKFGDKRIVLDCGMFQGPRDVRRRNLSRFPFDPSEVDWVVLSHAHLDHTGRWPLWVTTAVWAKILATAPTRELARLIMLDSASIQAGDEERAARKGFRLEDDDVMPVLYREAHVYQTLQRFEGEATYGESHDLGGGVSVVYHDAGHVVGSAFLELAYTSGGTTRRLTFSGDLGNVDKPLVNDPVPRQAGADIVLMESTYGARNHRPFADSVVEIESAIRATFERGGCVVIPAFALERSQELLYVLSELQSRGALGDARVYLDSPMAIQVTDIFKRFPQYLDPQTIEILREGQNPFEFEGLKFTTNVRQSKKINEDGGPAIIVSASGMCSGGRIQHHLRQRLPDERNAVLFIGYQAVGTLGREIVDGARSVRIHNRNVEVNASIHTVGGFSGHAGGDTMMEWLASADQPDALFLVHGETEPKAALGAAIKSRFGTDFRDPEYAETVTL